MGTTWDIAIGKCGNVCKHFNGITCDDYCKDNSGTLVKVYLGYVTPKQVPVSFDLDFELCQEGKCVLASHGQKVSKFGAPQPPSVISKEGYFIATTDVTRVLVEQGWTLDWILEKRLTARMTSSTRKYIADNLDVKTLPEPVVIVRNCGKGWRMEVTNGANSKLILNPNQDQSCYGDLLREWTSLL